MKKHSSARRFALANRLGQQATLLLAPTILTLLLTTANVWAQSGASGWSPPINFSNVPDMFSDSPILLCDRGQNLHAIWFERDSTQALIYYRTDSDGTWSSANDVFALSPITYLDGAITPDGILHLVWLGATTRELMYAQAPLSSAGDARQWKEPVSLANGLEVGQNVYGGGGTIAVDQSGRLHVVYAVQDSPEALSHTIYYIRSENSGASWSSPLFVLSMTTPEPANLFASIAVDGTGRLHIAWSLRSYEYASYSRVGYVRSLDGGSSWVDTREVAKGAPPFGVNMLGVFSFGDDKVHLTWDTPTRLHQWSSDGGTTWSTPTVIMDLGAAFAGFNKLVMDSAGTLHVVTVGSGGVFHAAFQGSTWSAKEQIDQRNIDPHTQQLVVCQGNELHVVYHDRTGENEIWYSTRQVQAPHIPRSPIVEAVNLESVSPSLAPSAGTTAPQSAASVPEAPSDSATTVQGLVSAPPASQPPALFVGASAAAAFVLIVVASTQIKKRR